MENKPWNYWPKNSWTNHCFESDLFGESVNKWFTLIRFLNSTHWFDQITIRRFQWIFSLWWVSLHILLCVSRSRGGTGLHGRLSQPVLLIQAAGAPPQTVFPAVCLDLCCSSCGGHAAALELFSNWCWIRRCFSRSSSSSCSTNKTREINIKVTVCRV